MRKILVSVTNDLTTDQRVAKVCKTLHSNGYEITLIGREQKNSLPINREYKTKRLKLLFNSGFLFYAEYNIRLFFVLLFSKKNILLANDLDVLIPNYILSKLQQKKIVFDSHELFSEVPELLYKPKIKKFWLKLENYIIPKLKNCYTVCDSISYYYKEKYKTDFKVVRNFPIKYDKTYKKNITTGQEKTIIYQGAVNLGRGLELIIDTMQFLSNFKLIIVGDGDLFEYLQNKVKLLKIEDKVSFLGRVTPEELQQITPKASVGISFEEDLGLNYRYALPNKIFDYIQAEVPILISDLPEMKKIVTNHNVGEIIIERDPKKIASQINRIIKNDYSLELEKAKNKLNWGSESETLLSVFKNLM